MPFVTLNLSINLLCACLLGIGGCLLGALGLLFFPVTVRRSERYAALLAFSLAGLSGASAFLGKPWSLWLPSLVLSAAWLLVQLHHHSWTHLVIGRLVRWFRGSQAQVGLLLAAMPVVVAGLLLPPRDIEVPVHRAARTLSGSRMPPTPQIVYALTDLETPIPLLVMSSQGVLADLPEMEQQFVELLSQNRHMINTAPAEAGHNCHGWVFTGGRYWIDGADVPRILEENGYHRVNDPHPGDLAIYRGGDGIRVTHTSVVRAVTEDGLVLVESKWGCMGRYIHLADKLRFGNTETYYRSSRQGHLLRDVEGLLPTEQPVSRTVGI